MKYFMAGVALAIIIFLAGCDDNAISSPTDVIFPDSNVSYAAHVAPFLTLGCNMSGCHDAPRTENRNIVLTSWSAVRGDVRVINQPGDTNAGLVQVLYGKVFHPLIQAGDNQRRGIRRWVIEGAQNN
jgi:hypothetical protein